jgi:glutamate/tyrosine decarboxylase-like PLP-dependent enzyme
MAKLAEQGVPWGTLQNVMHEARRGDVDWKRGRVGVYIHYAGEEVLDVAKAAYLEFFSENGLGPRAFPSLARFEAEVIEMTLGLLHGGDGASGSMTSGGTESIFLAVKSARDWARKNRPEIDRPEIVAPRSAHPAFDKAAHFLGLRVRRAALSADFRADCASMESLIGDNTIMMVGSAPAFPHGVIDPISDIGALAEQHGLWLHVDACVGGFSAPFARMAGENIPDFDFAVPAVRSMSADLHKYGFTAKGASTVLYRDSESFSFQGFTFDDWPRGHYSTQTLVGTRPGGAIAAAWAVMNFLGIDGYVDLTRRIIDVRKKLERGVRDLGLGVFGHPRLGIVSFGADEIDMFAVAEHMERRGWFVGRVQDPDGLHLMLNLSHEPIVEEYLRDLGQSVDIVRRDNLRSRVRNVTY